MLQVYLAISCTNVYVSVCERESKTTALTQPRDGPSAQLTMPLNTRIISQLGQLQIPLVSPIKRVSLSLAITCTNVCVLHTKRCFLAFFSKTARIDYAVCFMFVKWLVL